MSSGKDQSSPMPLALYLAAGAAVPNGQYSKLRCDATGALIVNTGGGPASSTPFDSAGDVTNLVISAVAADLLQIVGYNASAGVRYLLLHDAAALPPNGTVPDWVGLPVGVNQFVTFEFGDGLAFATGIVAAVSTTRATLTRAGADMWISGRVE